MNEAPDTEQEPAGYIRLPWQLVGAALLLFLVALFAFGMFANRNLRPQAATAPTASLVEPPTPTPVAVIAPTQTATAVPAPAITPIGAPAAAFTPTAVVRPEPSPTPSPVSQTSASPTVRPTVDPVLADDVSLAYEHYWQIRAEALLNLDASRLREVMDGAHLQSVEGLIRDLNSEGRAIETNIEHNYIVLEVSTDSAKIADTYISNSVYVDSHNHAQLTEPTGDRVTEVYDLSRVDGTWKVVSLASV